LGEAFVIYDVRRDAAKELDYAQSLLEDASRLVYNTFTSGNLDSMGVILDKIYEANKNIEEALNFFPENSFKAF
jgi:hypothetical protein